LEPHTATETAAARWLDANGTPLAVGDTVFFGDREGVVHILEDWKELGPGIETDGVYVSDIGYLGDFRAVASHRLVKVCGPAVTPAAADASSSDHPTGLWSPGPAQEDSRIQFQTYYAIDWRDATTGYWHSLDAVDTPAQVNDAVALLKHNARPGPCPPYRVGYTVTYEVWPNA
jgi:hypothetical protein